MGLAPGARLGPFEIVAPLGAGGMGEVYRAHDTRLKRTVAIKILAASPRDGPDPSRLERFQQEARAVARINHPGICALHDVGQDGDTTFLVMEYVAGETLSERLAGGALPIPLAVRTAAQVADALDHAHRQGVTHRDLKPANIMLTRDGVKILDFGLAKLREDPASAGTTTFTAAAPLLTEAGMIVGTVPYMSPEQIEGHAVDARSDIFSFGVVLYEMVTGRRPFAGDSRIALMAAIVGSEAPPPSTVQSLAPPALDRLIGRCLAKDPEDRWQDARDLAAELRWLPEAGSGAGPAAIAVAPRRSRRALLLAAVAGAGFAAIAAAVMVTLRRPEAPAASFNPVTFRRGVVTSARFSADGQSIVYSGSWQGGPHEVFLGRPGTADARSLQLADGRILAVSRTGDLAVHFAPRQQISPRSGTLAQVPLDGGARRDLLEGVVDADWIPGTQELAVVRVREDGRSQLEFPIGHKVHESDALWSLRVSPDGARVALFDGPGIFNSTLPAALIVIDRAGQKSTVARDLIALGLAWTPSGREVWFTGTDGRHAPSLSGASLSGRVREIYRAPDWIVLHDIAPDGRLLVARNSVRVAMSCQPAAGETVERDLTWLISSQVHAIARDGQSVTFAETLGAEPGMTDVYRRRLDGAPAVPLGRGIPQGFSPNDKWVLTRVVDGLVLLPTGAGSVVNLPKGKVARFGDGGWLDDARIVFNGAEEGAKGFRVFVQSIPDGLPSPITPEGLTLPIKAQTPDGRSILVRSPAGWQLYPVGEGPPRPVAALKRGDQPLQWSGDGRFLYAADRFGARPSSLDVFRVDVATGDRVLWKTLGPVDPIGVDNVSNVVLTPEATAYCYSHLRRLGDLFVVSGLK